jgi:CRISPR-associated DxTHG motif protein
MATYIIAFLGAYPSQLKYEYEHEGKAAVGRVFPEALRELVSFDLMYVCVTTEAKKQNWHILEADPRIKDIGIPDGKNPDELWKIFDKVTKKFNKNDEVIFDITHAFRSLPFLTFLFAAYLKVAKDVKIVSVLYGALDQGRASETPGIEKIVPVIQIGEFVSMLDWMSSTQRFVDLGDGNGLAQFLRKVDVPDLELKSIVDKTANAIERVSDALIYIRPMEVMESVAELQDLIPEIETQGRDLPQLQPFLLLCEQIVDRYKKLALANSTKSSNLNENLECQLAMMSWYQDYQQQIKSILLGRELFVSILAFWLGLDPFIKDNRNRSEYILNWKPENKQLERYEGDLNKFKSIEENITIIKFWRNTTEIRNDYAHTGMRKSPKDIKVIKAEINNTIKEIKICLRDFLAAASDRSTSLPNTSIATASPRPRLKPQRL